MAFMEKTVQVGEQSITIQTGKIAKQASGSVWVTAGGTSVLITATASKSPREGIDFLPLTVDYQEKAASAGKIPGGFFKREGKLRDSETLTSRLIDRSIRPLFAEGWGCETQIIATVFSADAENPADTLSMLGASAALTISDVPFNGPIAGIRVARIDGNFVANPSIDALEKADLDIFVSSSKDAICMVEGGAHELPESVMIDALLFAHESAQPLIAAQEEMQKEVGKAKREHTPPQVDKDLEAKSTKSVEALSAMLTASKKSSHVTQRSTQRKRPSLRTLPKQTLSLRHVRAKSPRSSVTSSTTWFASA